MLRILLLLPILLAATAHAREYGLTVVTHEKPRAPIEVLPDAVERAVVLVHGLDDPGWMWRDLAPRLLDAGFVVLRFEYPNDQAIADSAALLDEHLVDLRSRGVRRAWIVAHSMGGLVARDVLTREGLYGGDGGGDAIRPAIDRLIMIGTPNHGAPIARLRGLGEVREQISRFLRTGDWASGRADGRGEAGRDLLPKSRFLADLNARPHPAHTRYTIIAGLVSPWSPEEVASVGDSFKQGLASIDAPRWLRSWVDDITGEGCWLTGAVRSIGDGVVSLRSVTLDGVEDFVRVDGSHMSIIVNVSSSSDRVPPAIPVVVNRLAEDLRRRGE